MRFTSQIHFSKEVLNDLLGLGSKGNVERRHGIDVFLEQNPTDEVFVFESGKTIVETNQLDATSILAALRVSQEQLAGEAEVKIRKWPTKVSKVFVSDFCASVRAFEDATKDGYDRFFSESQNGGSDYISLDMHYDLQSA